MYPLAHQPVHQGKHLCCGDSCPPLLHLPTGNSLRLYSSTGLGRRTVRRSELKHDEFTVSLLATVVDSEGERCDGHTDSRADAQRDSHHERQNQEGN